MNNLWNILKKEIKEMFRDRKSLAMMLVVPIMIPLLVIGMSALFDSESNKSVTEYNKIGFGYELNEIERTLADELNIEVTEKSVEEIKKDYEKGSLDLYVTKDNNNYILNGNNNEQTSYAISLIETYFSMYKDYLQNQYLIENNIEPTKITNILTIDTNILSEDNFFANYIINYAFLFIIMAITVSATYPATDTTAGEKERGTLETLLTFPIKSRDIIIGKFLSVSLSSIITGIISLLLMIGSLLYANDNFKIYEGIELMLPISSLLFALIVIISYSFMISGLCIAIASKSKSFKEAQSALTPLTFIALFPGLIAFMIDVKSSVLLSLVPFLNYTLLFSDITAGNINYLNIFLMLISTIIVIAIILYIIIKQYKSEKVLFSN